MPPHLSTSHAGRPHVHIALAAIVLLTSTGCVTRGYKLVDEAKALPPVALNLAATEADAAVTLQTVIVYMGPGSWKREAYWDEYVLAIANRGDQPLTIASAALHDGKNEALAPGDNPWALEKHSKAWWQSNAAQQTKTYLALGAGTVSAAGLAFAGAMSGGIFGPMTAGGAAALGVGTAAFVALPVLAGGTAYMNYKRKHQVQDEFTRRRLALPLTVAPGQTAQGSLFFRITPSPRRLTLQCNNGSDTPHTVALELVPLAFLHLRPLPDAPRASAGSGQ